MMEYARTIRIKIFEQLPIFTRYVAVGISSLIINEGLLILLKGHFGTPLPVASVIAIETSVFSSFFLNDKWTFKVKNSVLPKWKRFFSYQTIAIGGSLINFSVLNVLAIIFGVDYRIANIIAIFVAFGWNYWINFNVTWKDHHQ